MQDDNLDWIRAYRRQQSQRQLRMAAFEKIRLQLESWIAAGELHRAYGKLPLATKKAHAVGNYTIANDWAHWINHVAIERLEEAEDWIATGRAADGLRTIQSLATLRGLPVSKTATERMTVARGNPDLREALRDADAEVAFARAQELLWQGEEMVAEADELRQLEIEERMRALVDERYPSLELVEPYAFEPLPAPAVPEEVQAAWALSADERHELFERLHAAHESFPDTRAGLRAKWILDVLQRDPLLVDAVAQHEAEQAARELLTRALNYRANQRPEEAVILLEQLLREFPESTSAQEARATLRGIREFSQGEVVGHECTALLSRAFDLRPPGLGG
jgi:hypothetical protein